MKLINKIKLGITIMAASVIFTGCGSTSVNGTLPTKTNNFKFEEIKGSETIYKVSYMEKGKKMNIFPLVLSAMKNTIQSTKEKGYQYFQIIAPKQISNIDGFPITNARELASYLNPQVTMPRYKIGFLEGKTTLMDNQNNQSVVNVPLTIFQDTTFEFIVRLVKKPKVEDIVWNTKTSLK